MRLGLAALMTLAAATAQAQALDALVAAAKAEGAVEWYSVILAEEAALPLARAFEAKYPGVKVNHRRANTMLIAQKIAAESREGAIKGDVFDGSTTVVPLLQAGLVDAYEPPSAAAIPEKYRDPQARWHSVLLEFLAPGYNSDLVSATDAPKTRDDLLDPKWKGRMIWSATPGFTGGAGFAANVLMDMGEASGMAWLARLRQQDITAWSGDGHSVIEQLSAKKYPLALQLFNHHTFLERSKGNPIQWIRMEPVLAFSNNMGIVKGAPHPNAARLFVNFVLSREGQTIIRDGRHIPASVEVEALEPSLKSGFRDNYVSPDKAAAKMADWQAAYDSIFK